MIETRFQRFVGITGLILIGFVVGVAVTVSSERSVSPTTLQAAIARLSPAPKLRRWSGWLW